MSVERTRLESLSADERAALSWDFHSRLSVSQIARRMRRSPEEVVHLILRGSRRLLGARPWNDHAGDPNGPGPLEESECCR